MIAPDRILPGWSKNTTVSGAAAGVWVFTKKVKAGKSPPHLTGLRKNAAFRKVGHMPALVYNGSTAVGWCQFEPTDELSRIKHKREYQNGLTKLPDWRITCFFVDREYRHKGITFLALQGALNEIARL